MDIKITEKTDNTLKAKITGASHQSLNLLQSELLKDKDVTFAAYRIDHPLMEEFSLIVKTHSKDVSKIISSANNSTIKKLKDFKKELLAAIK